MAKYKRTPQEVKAASPAEWVVQQGQRAHIELAAYAEACNLDRAGEYQKADEVLRACRVSAEVVDQRRRHIEWRLRQGFPAIGSQ